MKTGLVLLVLSSLWCWPLISEAQSGPSPELTETYAGEDFTLQYPAEWTLDAAVGDAEAFTFHILIAGEGAVGEGMVMSRDDMTALMSLQTSEADSALVFVRQQVDELVGDGGVFQAGIAMGFTISGRDAAFADVQGMLPVRFVGITLGDDSHVLVMLSGVPQQFIEVMPALIEVLNSARLPGDDTVIDDAAVDYLLPETHLRVEEWTFQYPEDWTVEEQDAYSLLVIPGTQTTVGISVLRDPDAAQLEGWAEVVLGNLLENFPNGEHELRELTLDDRTALRLDFRVSQMETGFTQWFLYLGEDALVNLTVIGAPLDIEMLSPLIEALVGTVQAADE